MNCLFCEISQSRQDAKIIYEDEHCLAILDIYPIRPGHTLVIPKKHVTDIHQLETDLYIHLMKVVRERSRYLQSTLNPKKVGMAIVGFDIDHLHVHLVPLEEYHDLTSQAYLHGTLKRETEEALAMMQRKLK
ncbi:HIT family protein [Shouchella lehensis]|uniref:Nucleotide-binding histidine triad protein n=1 Tax=Shouchella lehensis G1 TaxID=1246626 RepID=A0A060M1A9_9BACI|nr:HIT family protein [Shouchella lehensis]AIC96207.1 nucleotide-binding histidine triad protein [Shouchella lehensis G1]